MRGARDARESTIRRESRPLLEVHCRWQRSAAVAETWGASPDTSLQLPDELVQRAQSVQRKQAQQPTVSRLQQRVNESLRGMGQQPELEALTDDGLFSIDIALTESEQDGRLKTAVEVDGPQHFTSSGGKTGSAQLRDFLLEQRGWRVITLPYFAIDAASTDDNLKVYLAGSLRHKPRESFPTMGLRLSSGVPPDPAPSSPFLSAALDT